uniref:Uncharacterized protein n=1 Tax=Anguilla anguilla TaxID=7936 RepID=A0A0E9SXJ5_ANGAN
MVTSHSECSPDGIGSVAIHIYCIYVFPVVVQRFFF